MNRKKSIKLFDKVLIYYYRRGWRGFQKIWQVFKVIFGRRYLCFCNKYGAKFWLDPFDFVDSFVIHSGYYESEVLEAILPYIDKDAVFWDIGAYFGLHGVTVKVLRPEAQVVCIEPSFIAFERLYENCLLNNICIDMIKVGLSDTAGTKVFYLGSPGNTGISTFKPLRGGDYCGKVISPVETGDNLVLNNLIPRPTVIKLDVENSQFEVVKGLTDVLKDVKLKAIIFEDQNHLLADKAHSEVCRLFFQSGFIIEELKRSGDSFDDINSNYIALRI